LLEVGTLFCLVTAGYYAIYTRSFNWWALLILGASLAPFLYAIQKPKREPYLGLAVLGLIAGSVLLFVREDGRPAVNPLLAILASGSVTAYIWIAVRKSVQAAHMPPSHDLQALLGKIGEAKTRIGADGSVQVAGELWSARSGQPIPIGSSIRVVDREGFVLVVEKTHPANSSTS
jgi:membrane-bound ClpP family serine protease